jgi:hypothetical protein
MVQDAGARRFSLASSFRFPSLLVLCLDLTYFWWQLRIGHKAVKSEPET